MDYSILDRAANRHGNKRGGIVSSKGHGDPQTIQSAIVMNVRASPAMNMRLKDKRKTMCPLGDDVVSSCSVQRGEVALLVDTPFASSSRGGLGAPTIDITTAVNGLAKDATVKFAGITMNPSMSKGMDNTMDDAAVTGLFGSYTTTNMGPNTIGICKHILMNPKPVIEKDQSGNDAPGIQEIGQSTSKYRAALYSTDDLNVTAVMQEVDMLVDVEPVPATAAAYSEACKRICRELELSRDEVEEPAEAQSLCHYVFVKMAINWIVDSALSAAATQALAEALNRFDEHEIVARNRYGSMIGDVEIEPKEKYIGSDRIGILMRAGMSALMKSQSYQHDMLRSLHVGLSMNTSPSAGKLDVLVGGCSI